MAERAARSMKSTRASTGRVPATSANACRAPLPAGHARPLPPALASEMGQRFGQDFSSVRMHEDAQAQRSAEQEQARAYTIGEHIVWGHHAPPPASHEGQHTLAHELAHVVQQRRGGPPPVQSPNAAHEVGADRAAAAVVSGTGAVSVSGATGVGVARQPMDPRHARGYAGEQGMGFEQYPRSEGWVFVEGPSGAAGHNATAPGFDGVAYKPASNELHIADNKSFKRTGNVHSATAITKNLGKNLNDLIAKVEAMPKKGFPYKAKVLSLLKQARDALAAGKPLPSRVKLTVTGTGGNSTGVSQRLQKLGVEYRDITSPPSKMASAGGTKGAAPPTPKAQAKAGSSKAGAARANSAKSSAAKSQAPAAKGNAAKPPAAKQAASTSPASKAGSTKGTAAQAKPTGKVQGKQATTSKSGSSKATTAKPGASAKPGATAKSGAGVPASKTSAPAAKAGSQSSAAPKKSASNTTPKPTAKAGAAKTNAPKSTAKAAPPKPGASKGGGPKSTIKIAQTKTGANAKASQAKNSAASSTAPKSRPSTAKSSAAKPSASKPSASKPSTAKAPLPKGKTSRPMPAKPTTSRAATPRTLPPAPPKTTPAPTVTKPATPPPAAAKPAMPEPIAPRPGVARPGVAKPGVPEPGMPAPKGGGPTVGGAAMSVAFPIVAGVIHNKAVEKRVDKQSDEQGFVPHNAPSGEGRLYDLGAWLIDPTREAERNVDPEKRFKISPWRQKVRNLANFTIPGSTFDFTWEDPYCSQDLFGNPEVKYRYQKVTYRKGFDGRLTVESGDATGTLDLNDVINEAIPDEEIDGRIPRGTCGDDGGGLA